ncbi:hypothetical protein HYH03_003436 [Edaphochlamys debaryana]|uniref:Uncharacterized protein n=1 Tax=Edaphochlamys debaryana TaxID=47281 RepID=A0A835YD76_9CHLO|nr:hypothetical protein HYH03_003436 [Edaphochlamys debaryana]|eukprot:KAG2498696.1 hypothetical protein HYH03_003436 [Edaphochlamys debaryana]
MFFALDSTIINLAGGLLTMLNRGWDTELPYVVSDCLVSPAHNGTDRTAEVHQMCDLAAPHCLPCHASSPGYWHDLVKFGGLATAKGELLLGRVITPGTAGLAGCPCTPALACAAAAQDAAAGPGDHRTALLRCMDGATHRHFIAPAGGVALSRGLLKRMGGLELAQMAEVLSGLASTVHNMNAAEAGFELLSRLLWDAGHAVTSPMDVAPITLARYPMSRFGRLPFMWKAPGQPPPGGFMGNLVNKTMNQTSMDSRHDACQPPICTTEFLRIVSSNPARELQPPSKALYELLSYHLPRITRDHAGFEFTQGTKVPQSATGTGVGRKPFYQMESCVSRYPGQRCPVPEACYRGTNCMMIGRGSFNWEVEEEDAFYSAMNFYVLIKKGHERMVDFWLVLASGASGPGHIGGAGLGADHQPYAPPNRPMCLDMDGNGTWFHGQWSRNNASLDGGEDCDFHRVPRKRVVEALTGKKIWFSGDSLNRQLFHRLVWYLRGQEAVMEHYYHQMALYTMYKNDTDSFEIGPYNERFGRDLELDERFRIFHW